MSRKCVLRQDLCQSWGDYFIKIGYNKHRKHSLIISSLKSVLLMIWALNLLSFLLTMFFVRKYQKGIDDTLVGAGQTFDGRLPCQSLSVIRHKIGKKLSPIQI